MIGASRPLSVRTLTIASVASATAAVITSRLWAPGTALAAGLTPVIVSIVGELLNRPAEHVSRLRASRSAASRTSTEALANEGPHAHDGPPGTPTAQATRPSGRRRLHLKVALVTAAIAFVIAAAALTLPELIFGKSVASDRHTTIFGGNPPENQAPRPAETAPQTTQTAPETTDTAPPAKAPPQATTTTPPTPPPLNRQPPRRQTPPAGQTTSPP